jgi:hypothetical protein
MPRPEDRDEHLDDIVYSSADRMDRRFHCVSCGRRLDSSVAGFRRDLANPAFCPGHSDGLKAQAVDRQPPFFLAQSSAPQNRPSEGKIGG